LRKRNIDWFALIPVLLLLCIGLIMVLSASSPITVNDKSKDFYVIFRKQLVWVAIGIIAMYLAANYYYRKLQKFVIPVAVITVILLLAVFAFEARNGAHGWIIIGSNQFQPSELVKLCLIVILAKMLSSKTDKMDSFKEGLMPPLIAIGVVCILVVLEPDLGSTVVIALTSFVMLFAGGARYIHLFVLALGGVFAIVAAVLIAPYRFVRVLSFINPDLDPAGAGYQITQSLYAIGSGGFMGVGLGRSMQKFYRVPEQHTDFIFSILAEELGFVGGVFIILLFAFFAARGYLIAKNSRDNFGSLLACGLTTAIVVEAVINIAVVTSSMPVTGITLPFISYGGSSLIFKMAAVGILLNISKYSNQSEVWSVGSENTRFTKAVR